MVLWYALLDTSILAALYEYFAAAFTGVHISANITEIDKHGEIWVDLAHPNSPFDLLYELFNGYKAVQVHKKKEKIFLQELT